MNVPLRLVESFFDLIQYDDQGIGHGAPQSRGCGKYYAAKDVEPAGLLFFCPGCLSPTSIAFIKFDGHATWAWDGNREKPTCTPSILHRKNNDDNACDGCGWHGYLTAGVFIPC